MVRSESGSDKMGSEEGKRGDGEVRWESVY